MQTQPDRSAWLKGGNACCNVRPPTQKQPHRLVLLGAPGAGKGTQAELLAQRLGACHLSTGDIFRAPRNGGDREPGPTMEHALACMRRGELVSDDTVLSLVAERVGCLHCGGGFLLDGFPRTVAQASALTKFLASQGKELEAVLNFYLPIESITARLSGRRTCHKCKAVFHIETRPAEKPGICDNCGSALYQREDDRPEVIRVRMEAYQRTSEPLIEYYRRQELLIPIPADGTPEEIFQRSIEAL